MWLGSSPSTQVTVTYSFTSEVCLPGILYLHHCVIEDHVGDHLMKVNGILFILIAHWVWIHFWRHKIRFWETGLENLSYEIVSYITDWRSAMQNRLPSFDPRLIATLSTDGVRSSHQWGPRCIARKSAILYITAFKLTVKTAEVVRAKIQAISRRLPRQGNSEHYLANQVLPPIQWACGRDRQGTVGWTSWWTSNHSCLQIKHNVSKRTRLGMLSH